ncbi:MAG: helix-turn-helix domain-containing protein [Candidatus Aenigmatarchaeota archaeon]
MALEKKLEELEKRLSDAENLLYILKKRLEILENLPKLKLILPEHLLPTFLSIYQLERATASQVAEKTKRARAVESAYLNQLVTMGYLKKEKEKRYTYFKVDYSSPLSKELLKALQRK